MSDDSDADAGAPTDAGANGNDPAPTDGGVPDGTNNADQNPADGDAAPVDGGDTDPTADDDCDCTLCNAANGASIARGGGDTNGAGSPGNSPCLPDGPIQSFIISNIRQIDTSEVLTQLNARMATWQFQPYIVAANALGFVVGIGPAVDAGIMKGVSFGGGWYFAPGNKVGMYGTAAQDDGMFSGSDIGLSFTVIYGMDNFSGPGYALGASAEFGIGGSIALTFSGSGVSSWSDFTGYCATAGYGFSAGFWASLSHTRVWPSS